MKLFFLLIIALAHRINCNGGYGAPSKKSSAQIGLTVGIEKEEVYLNKDPGQLVLQLGDNGYGSGGGYKNAGGYGAGGDGYGGGSGGDYEGSYGGGYGGDDGKMFATDFNGGYGGGHDGGYGANYGSGGEGGAYAGGGYGGHGGDGAAGGEYGGGCGGCGGDGYAGLYSSGSETGGAYYKLGEAAQAKHRGYRPRYHQRPRGAPGKGPVESYVVHRTYTTNDYHKKPAPYMPVANGKHYKAGYGSGNIEFVKLGVGDAYEDGGLVVSTGKYVASAYDPHRKGDLAESAEQTPETPEKEAEVAAETQRFVDLDFASDEFHNRYYNEMIAAQGLGIGQGLRPRSVRKYKH